MHKLSSKADDKTTSSQQVKVTKLCKTAAMALLTHTRNLPLSISYLTSKTPSHHFRGSQTSLSSQNSRKTTSLDAPFILFRTTWKEEEESLSGNLGHGLSCTLEPPSNAVSVSIIINLQTAMVFPQFHINHNDFFKTVHPTARNPPTYSN